MLCLLLCSGCYKPESESYPLGHEKNPVVMAFVPSTEAQKVIDSGEELVQLLEQECALAFKATMATSYVGIVETMAVGKVHVAWLPPMAYVYAHQRNGDEVLLKVVRKGKSTYRGQVVVMADSPINSIEDLRGKTVAYTDPASASGYLFPASLLISHGLDLDEDLEMYPAGSHDAALLALLKGSVDAAFCYDDVRTKLLGTDFSDVMETTRILSYTDDIPADNVTASSKLDAAIANKVKAALVNLVATEHGQAVMFDLYEVEDLVDSLDSDYDGLRIVARQLGLDIELEVRKGK